MALAPKRTLIIGGGLALVLILYALGAKKQPPSSSSTPTANASQCVVTVDADTLNIRSTPALNGKIVGKLAKGKQVNADKVVQNGFRKLSDNQWVSVDFAKPVQGHDCG